MQSFEFPTLVQNSKRRQFQNIFFCSIPYNPGLVNDFEEDIKAGYSSSTIFPQRIYELK